MMFQQIKKGIPNPNQDDKQKKSIANTREIYKASNFNKTKVRAIISCGNCDAPRCIYSQNILVRREGQPHIKLNNWTRGLTVDIFVGTRIQLKDFYDAETAVWKLCRVKVLQLSGQLRKWGERGTNHRICLCNMICP